MEVAEGDGVALCFFWAVCVGFFGGGENPKGFGRFFMEASRVSYGPFPEVSRIYMAQWANTDQRGSFLRSLMFFGWF